jgi:hypothetical protein
MLQDILASILTSSVITGIFVVILNKAIENKFDMKLEAYKDKLKAESDKELLQLTKDLELKASERNIKLTEIFTKQANVVVETYSYIVTTEHLVELAHGLLRYLNHETHDHLSQLSGINKTAHDVFQKSFKVNRIYLPKHTAKQMDSYLATISELLSKSSLIAGLTPIAKANNWQSQIDELHAEVQQLEKEIPVLLETLEDDFQRILGFPMPDKEKTA